MNVLTLDQCPYDISIAHLKNASIFGALSDSAIEYLLSESILEEYEDGELVFEDKAKSECFYVVLDGSVGFSKQVDGVDKPINFGVATVGFGEALGYVTMIALTPRASDAKALKKTLLLNVNCQVFGAMHDAFAFDFGILILNLSRDMARKIRIISDIMAEKPSN